MIINQAWLLNSSHVSTNTALSRKAMVILHPQLGILYEYWVNQTMVSQKSTKNHNNYGYLMLLTYLNPQ